MSSPDHVVISVIVPTLNEEQCIALTVRDVRKQVSQVDTRLEVVVVDGGSTDRTGEAARCEGVKCGTRSSKRICDAYQSLAKFIQTAPGRGRQLNAGASASSGSIYVFLHADTRLTYGFDHHVRTILEDRKVSLGAFRLKIDSNLRGIRVVQFFANIRAKYGGMPYGDQSFFCRKSTFEELGGFPDMDMMEDFQMASNARKHGRVKIANADAITSGRRWERVGVVKTTILNQFIVTAYLCGVPLPRLKRWYRGAMGQ